MNYLESNHYKFGIRVGYINLFIIVCLLVLEGSVGLFKPNWSAGAGLLACAISIIVLTILGILNLVFNVVLYCLNDKNLEFNNFPQNYKDYFYLYYFGFFHVLIGKRLGWFMLSLPIIFIWSFIANLLLGSLAKIVICIVASILYEICG